MDFNEWMTLLQYITMLSAGAIVLLSLIGAFLYRKAYRQMKRSKIIGALAFLLFAIAIKFIFVLMAFSLVWRSDIDLATFNSVNLLPNILVMWALWRFIYTSIETPKEAKDCLSKVDKKDIRKI
jgi:hypothetical protein